MTRPAHAAMAGLVAVLASLGGTTAASAAVPFTVGAGDSPAVAVGPTGTGHVVWTTASQVGHCRVAPAGGACDHQALLSFPTGPDGRPEKALVYAPSASKVVIVGGCFCAGHDRVFVWRSLDGGVSFGAGVEITGPGTLDLAHGSGTWLDDVGGGVFVGTSGASLRAMPPAPEPVTFPSGWDAHVARLPATNRLVFAADDVDGVRYSVYHGPALSPLTAAAINSQANWSGGPYELSAPEGENSESGLNAGPAGLYLTYKWAVPGNPHIGLRRFDPASGRFGAASYIEGEDPIDDRLDQPDTSQDVAGRIHAIWHSDGRLRYTLSDTSGANFAPAATLATREDFYDARVAAAPDAHGFAVWHGNGSTPVRVVALDPLPEAAPAVTEPATTPPAIPTPPALPAGAPARGIITPSRSKTIAVPGGTMTLSAPGGCIDARSSFRATLRFKRRGGRRTKVTRVEFLIDGRRARVDRTSPFTQTVAVRSATPGSRHSLTARAFVTRVRRTISITFDLC